MITHEVIEDDMETLKMDPSEASNSEIDVEAYPVAKLVDINDQRNSYCLYYGVNKIGRGIDCDVQILTEKMISRKHAEISMFRHDSFIQDLDSTNGVKIGRKRIKSRTLNELKNGCTIQIGNFSVRFEVMDRYAEEKPANCLTDSTGMTKLITDGDKDSHDSSENFLTLPAAGGVHPDYMETMVNLDQCDTQLIVNEEAETLVVVEQAESSSVIEGTEPLLSNNQDGMVVFDTQLTEDVVDDSISSSKRIHLFPDSDVMIIPDSFDLALTTTPDAICSRAMNENIWNPTNSSSPRQSVSLLISNVSRESHAALSSIVMQDDQKANIANRENDTRNIMWNTECSTDKPSDMQITEIISTEGTQETRRLSLVRKFVCTEKMNEELVVSRLYEDSRNTKETSTHSDLALLEDKLHSINNFEKNKVDKNGEKSRIESQIDDIIGRNLNDGTDDPEIEIQNFAHCETECKSVNGSMSATKDDALQESIGKEDALQESIGKEDALQESIGKDDALQESIGKDDALQESIGKVGALEESIGKDDKLKLRSNLRRTPRLRRKCSDRKVSFGVNNPKCSKEDSETALVKNESSIDSATFLDELCPLKGNVLNGKELEVSSSKKKARKAPRTTAEPPEKLLRSGEDLQDLRSTTISSKQSNGHRSYDELTTEYHDKTDNVNVSLQPSEKDTKSFIKPTAKPAKRRLARTTRGSALKLKQKKEAAQKADIKDINFSDSEDFIGIPKSNEKSQTKKRLMRSKTFTNEASSDSNSKNASSFDVNDSQVTTQTKVVSSFTARSKAKRKYSKKNDSKLSKQSSFVDDLPSTRIMFTGLDEEKWSKLSVQLGGRVVSEVEDCTHLVTDRVRRTLKFLHCIVLGIPIVKTSWLAASKASGRFVGLEGHQFGDIQDAIDSSRQSRIFEDCSLFFTLGVKPSPKELRPIIECAGGHVNETLTKKSLKTIKNNQCFVVMSPEDPLPSKTENILVEFIEQGVPMVSAEFVLAALMTQTLELEKYRIEYFKKTTRSDSVNSRSKKTT